jgi:hypothetical protein
MKISPHFIFLAILALLWPALLHAAQQAASVKVSGNDLLFSTLNGAGDVSVDGTLRLKAAHAVQLQYQV